MGQAATKITQDSKYQSNLLSISKQYQISTKTIIDTGLKRTLCLASEQIITTYVCAHIGAQFSGQSLLFVPNDESSPSPEGLVIQEGLGSSPSLNG